MSRIGCTHAARLLLSIQCQGISADIGTPEDFLEFLFEASGLRLEGICLFKILQRRGKPGSRTFGGVGVTLDLAQGDGRLGETSIGVENKSGRMFQYSLHKSVACIM